MKTSGIKEEIFRIVKSSTAKKSGIVFIGNFLAAVLAFLFMVLSSRYLGPKQFGTFSAITALMATIAGITELGIGTSLIRFVSLYLNSNLNRAKAILKLLLQIKFLISILLILIGLIWPREISELVFRSKDYEDLIRLAFFGAVAISLGTYMGSVFQAYQWFGAYSLWQIIQNIVRLIVLFLFIYLGWLSEYRAILIYISIPLLAVFIGYRFIPSDILRYKNHEDSREVLAEVFHFSKWIAVSFFANSLYGRFDTILLTRYHGSEVTGLYNVSFQLSMLFPMVINSISTVLLPKMSGIIEKKNLINFTKKSAKALSGLVICFIIIFIFANQVITLTYGKNYALAALPFRIFVIGYMIATILTPINVFFYAKNQPQVLAYMNIIQMVVNIVGNLLIIPKYGMVGASCVWLITSIIGIPVIFYYVYQESKRRCNPGVN